MSKNRIKQRRNRQTGRYIKALAGSRSTDIADMSADLRIMQTDECGRRDLTGYNAIKLMENKNWSIVYK